ncbi:MAG: orotidine-5'-phosphate decarboxylase [Candidatus Nealsonbacteria bacterium]|nr:orotidine-5'-phosphate decarboxylase [Candidatus Nealsonbacteria bacterium]
MIQAKFNERKSVCVGLDADSDKIPEAIKKGEDLGMARFNFAIVNATSDLVCAYKPNIAFYESLGAFGIVSLKATVGYIKTVAPDVLIIGDMKRADIGNTNLGYIKAAFEYFGFDAITVHPYLGREALQPFLDQKDKGIFVLCRTSNKGAKEFQDLKVVVGDRYIPLYQYVAHRVAADWNQNNNCGLVVGATYPEELAQVRAVVGDDMPILVPAIGAQGGDLEKTIKAGKKNMIINASRSIIFASSGSDFAEAARRETLKLHEAINGYSTKGGENNGEK